MENTSFNPDAFAAPAGSEAAFRAQYELDESDKGLSVEFHIEPVLMPYLTKIAREGEPEKGIKGNPDAPDVIEYQEFIKIRIPGQDKTVVDTPITPAYIKRFRAAYDAFKANQSQTTGTPLTDLPGLMPDFLAKCKTLNVHSVEHGAAVTDLHGPNLGLGWRKFRDDCRKHLANKDSNVDALKARIALLEAQVAGGGKRTKTQD
jgi:hypothetical protein